MKTKLLMLMLALPFAFAACESKLPAPDAQGCQVKATFRQNICGVGVWGGLVLELEDGTIIQPWATDSKAVAEFVAKPNISVWIGYEAMNPDGRYDGISRCLAIGEYEGRISKVVKINCISQDSVSIASSERQTAVVSAVDFGCAAVGVWGGIQFFEASKKVYFQPWAASDKVKAIRWDFSQIIQNKVSFKIAYSEINRDSTYNQAQVCPTFAALPASTPIMLHEIEVVSD